MVRNHLTTPILLFGLLKERVGGQPFHNMSKCKRLFIDGCKCESITEHGLGNYAEILVILQHFFFKFTVPCIIIQY